MYFKLRKVKKMITSKSDGSRKGRPEEEQIQLLQIHKHLKEVERDINATYWDCHFR